MIRTGTLADRSAFLLLWSEHMVEQEKDGSHVRATRANLYRQLDNFEAYVNGVVSGLCLFHEVNDKPVALVLAGETIGLNDWDTDMGKVASLWGVYVQPSYRGQGIGVKLFQRAFELGLEMGFDAVETYIRMDNPHGQRVAAAFGTAPYLQQHLVSLHDPKVLDNDEAHKALGREVNDGR